MFVKCGCCATPVAEIVGSEIVIQSRHHGQVHETRLAIPSLTAPVAINQAITQGAGNHSPVSEVQPQNVAAAAESAKV